MTNEGERQAIRDVLQALASAVGNKDAAALEALHAPNTRIFDLAPPLGKGFDARELVKWLESWDGPVNETWADLDIEISGGLAVCNGYVRIETARGGEEASWWMRRTVTLKRTGDAWRIAHDHSSVPFYMDGSDRAALDLAPGDSSEDPNAAQ